MDGPLWPTVDYGTTISDKTQKPGIEDPIYLLSLLRNDLCNQWYLPQLERALIGRLFKIQYLELVKLDGAKVIGSKKLPLISVVRNVAQGPDFIYLG
jgi:hypothetical protein